MVVVVRNVKIAAAVAFACMVVFVITVVHVAGQRSASMISSDEHALIAMDGGSAYIEFRERHASNVLHRDFVSMGIGVGSAKNVTVAACVCIGEGNMIVVLAEASHSVCMDVIARLAVTATILYAELKIVVNMNTNSVQRIA